RRLLGGLQPGGVGRCGLGAGRDVPRVGPRWGDGAPSVPRTVASRRRCRHGLPPRGRRSLLRLARSAPHCDLPRDRRGRGDDREGPRRLDRPLAGGAARSRGALPVSARADMAAAGGAAPRAPWRARAPRARDLQRADVALAGVQGASEVLRIPVLAIGDLLERGHHVVGKLRLSRLSADLALRSGIVEALDEALGGRALLHFAHAPARAIPVPGGSQLWVGFQPSVLTRARTELGRERRPATRRSGAAARPELAARI